MKVPRLYSAGMARQSLMGREATHNPSLPAASMLRRFGVPLRIPKLQVAGAARKALLKRKKNGKRGAHRGPRQIVAGGGRGTHNPIGAALAAAGGIKEALGSLFKSSDPKKDLERGAKIDAAFAARDRGPIAYWSTQGASAPQRQYALQKLGELDTILREEREAAREEAQLTARERRAIEAQERREARAATTAERGALFSSLGMVGEGIASAALRGRSLPRPRRRTTRRRRR